MPAAKESDHVANDLLTTHLVSRDDVKELRGNVDWFSAQARMASIFVGLRRAQRFELGAFLAATALAGHSSISFAQSESGSTVSGIVEFAAHNELAEPAVHNLGFLERSRNPFRPPQPHDPRPEMIVVLGAGVPLPADAAPPRATVNYDVQGEQFEVPILPVVAGSEVKIRNDKKTGKVPRRLYSPSDPQLIEEGVLKPGGARSLKKVNKPYKLLELRDRDSAHLRGRILTLPHRYFSLVDKDGKFEITGVPPGAWKIQIWYRDGWLQMPTVEIEVRPTGATKKRVELPAQLHTVPPKN
jgi:hypothetical protein